MVNLEKFIDLAYLNLVGEIPQVFDNFVHHFGEDKTDLKISLGNLEVCDKEVFANFIRTYFNNALIDEAIKGAWCNKFTLVKLKSFIQDDELIITDENLKEHSDDTITELIIAIIQIIHKKEIAAVGTILVHFPKVTITNENDRSIDIFDFYAKVKVNIDATMYEGVSFCKATYTFAQWENGYMHSHIPTVDNTRPERFNSSCLGSGPLSRTIPMLRVSGNGELWPLFCLELERYVEVESLQGGPYKKLEYITRDKNKYKFKVAVFNPAYNKFPIPSNDTFNYMFNRFIEIIVDKKAIPIVYSNDLFEIGDNFVNTAITLSNLFIDFYNNEYLNTKGIEHVSIDDLFKYGVVCPGTVEDSCIIYTGLSDNGNIPTINNKLLFKFKDKEIRLNILPDNSIEKENLPLFLNHHIISSIVFNFLTFINHADEYNKYKQHPSSEDVKKGITL